MYMNYLTQYSKHGRDIISLINTFMICSGDINIKFDHEKRGIIIHPERQGQNKRRPTILKKKKSMMFQQKSQSIFTSQPQVYRAYRQPCLLDIWQPTCLVGLLQTSPGVFSYHQSGQRSPDRAIVNLYKYPLWLSFLAGSTVHPPFSASIP